MFEAFFTPEAVDKLRPMMQETIDTLLDNMIRKGCQEPVDFIRNFAESIPIQVCQEIFNLRQDKFIDWLHRSFTGS